MINLTTREIIGKSNMVFRNLMMEAIPPLTSFVVYFLGIKVPWLFFWIATWVVFALLGYTLISGFNPKNTLRQKFERIHHNFNEICNCVVFSSIMMVCLGVVIIKQEYDQKKLREELLSFMRSEQLSIISNGTDNSMNGIASYYAGDYQKAAILLKKHHDDPVSEYYYGLMLFNGIGMQKNERDGFEHIRTAADKHFFRAMNFMVEWGARNSRLPDIIPYADMMVHSTYIPKSMRCINDDLALKQQLELFDACQKSYSIAQTYNIYVRKSFYKSWCLTNDYYSAIGDFFGSNACSLPEELDKAWQIWTLESRFLGKLYMWLNANIRFSHSVLSHFEYALMLLNLDKQDVEATYNHISLGNVSKRNLRSAERELDKALKIAINENYVSYQYNSLQLLEKILHATGRENDAVNISILVSNLKLKDYYEKLDK